MHAADLGDSCICRGLRRMDGFVRGTMKITDHADVGIQALGGGGGGGGFFRGNTAPPSRTYPEASTVARGVPPLRRVPEGGRQAGGRRQERRRGLRARL